MTGDVAVPYDSKDLVSDVTYPAQDVGLPEA